MKVIEGDKVLITDGAYASHSGVVKAVWEGYVVVEIAKGELVRVLDGNMKKGGGK